MELPVEQVATPAAQAEGIVAEVKAEVKAVETKVETAVKSAVAEVKKVEEKIVHTAENAVIAITAEEKLAIRELENKFLKTQMEITRLQNVAQEVQKNFPMLIEQLKQKYVVDPATYVFDSNKLEFRRK